MYDIITVGSATRDVFLKSKSFDKLLEMKKGNESIAFPLGSKNEVEEIFLSTGGGATNTSVFFARQGLKTACIARIGKDSFGDEIIEKMKQEGVSCDFIQRDENPETGYSTIITVKDGSRVVLVKRGVSGDLNFSEIKLSELKTKWLYISSLAGNIDLLFKLVSYAKENNIKIAFNPGSLELKAGLEKLRPFLDSIDVFILNEDEAATLLGMSSYEEKDIFNKLDELIKGIAVMTKGSKGVSVSDGKNIYSAGIPKSNIVERTGAGDAFGSGFVSFIASGKSIEDAIQMGTANSTSVVQYYSAKTGLLKEGDWGCWDKVEVEKILIK